MSRIAIPGRDDAPLEAQRILDNVKKILGFVPNLQRLMSISPNALAGWAGLMGSLSKTLDVKTRDAIALAVSEADACNYCLAAHSYIATNLAKISPEEIALNREGRSTDPKRQAAVAFARGFYAALAHGESDPLVGADTREEQRVVHATIGLDAMLAIEKRTVER